MADISKEIQDFKEAVYGEEVRGSLVSLAEKINDEVEENTEKVTEYGQAESGRAQAEKERASAETQRQQEFQTAKEAAEQAADSANQASQQIQQNAAAGNYSASVGVGTVTTGDPGTQATVTNVGTSKDAIFNFVIPQGPKGSKGDPGDKGDPGSLEGLKDAAVEFSEAVEKENLQSGDTIAVLFGKIQKYFTALDSYWPRLNQVQQVDISEVFPNMSNTAGITIGGKLTIITFGINISPYTIKLVCMEVSVTTQNKAIPNISSLGNVKSEYSGFFGQMGVAVAPPIDCKYVDGYGTSEIGARIGVYPYSSGFSAVMHNVASSAGSTKKYIGSATWIAAY